MFRKVLRGWTTEKAGDRLPESIRDFSPSHSAQAGSGARPVRAMSTVVFPRELTGRGVKLTIHTYTVLGLRMYGAIPARPQAS